VEDVLRRLMFQFKYMPPRELLEMHLQGKDDARSSDLQGTMIWFLINHIVRDSKK